MSKHIKINDPAGMQYDGMTLRDHFAGQALIGYLTTHHNTNPLNYEGLAKSAYSLADAMLAERSKTK